MTLLLAGIDFSTTAIHAALIPYHPGDETRCILRRARLPAYKPNTTTPQYRSADRCRHIAGAIRVLLGEPRTEGRVISVWVEEPFGGGQHGRGQTDNTLREIYGGILASIPFDTARASIAPTQWRKTITSRSEGLGLCAPPTLIPNTRRRDWKAWSVTQASRWMVAHEFDPTPNEHEADALLIALAGRHHEHAGHRSGGTLNHTQGKAQLRLEPTTEGAV